MELLKIFIISSVITLVVVFLYFLYQTHRIKRERDNLDDIYMDDSLDTYKLKCPSGYRYNGTTSRKDNCKLDINLNCSNKTKSDCNGYCKWDDVTSKCEDNTELTYPELDTINVPELKRDTFLDNSYQKRCETNEFNWPAIKPYCDHIDLQQKNN